MKKLLLALMGLVVGAMCLTGCGGGGKTFINIATGGTAGTYYPLGGAMADIFNKNIPNCNASAQSTGASVANVNLLQQGKVDIGFIQNDIAYYAATGTEMFKDKKVDGLLGMATLYPETVQIVTLKKSGIKSVADFKGKRVAVGAAGSGTEANARQIMAAYDITYDMCKVQYLSFAEASSALKDGNVDVAFVTAGHPTAAIQDISTTNDVVLIPMPADKADALIAKYPFYTKLVIPAKTYNKQTSDVPAVAVRCMLAVTSKMSDDTAYKATKALYTNLDRMKAAHSAANFITKESALDGMSIKVVGGAQKFYDEK